MVILGNMFLPQKPWYQLLPGRFSSLSLEILNECLAHPCAILDPSNDDDEPIKKV